MPTIHKVLIANRGEIALRIIRTCTQMGIPTVAVYSDADRYALFVEAADEAIALGGNTPAESYLVIDKIIAAAHRTGANAIHPGYGFLSENAQFARRCAAEGIIFIGPHAEAIEQMGLKREAKLRVEQFGVPTIPGYQDEDQSVITLLEAARKIGFPVLLKASAGGGGKGMRIVRHEAAMAEALAAAQREALAAFGNDTMLIEKYFDSARHVEFQILGDQHGNIVHCFERECSIQRRYQKIIEESPSPILTPELRQQMGEAAVNAARSVGYDNAGTVEFIVVPDGKFYFLEVNTRLQVEHPVTEMITGLDLVRLQIDIAQGEPLPFAQADLEQKGHAIEVRLYAEDDNYLPQTGTVQLWQTGRVAARFDTAIGTGSVISMFYDPMIAKIIVHAPTRARAIRQMQRVLEELVVLGITSNKQLLWQILQHPDFLAGQFDTHFLAQQFTLQHIEKPEKKAYFLIAAFLQQIQKRQQQRTLLKGLPTAWRNLPYQAQEMCFEYQGERILFAYTCDPQQQYRITIDGKIHTARSIEQSQHQIVCEIDGHRLAFQYAIDSKQYFYLHQANYGEMTLKIATLFPDHSHSETKGGYKSPMPGEVVRVLVEVGQRVESGQALVVLSSMKMENTIEANETGEVEAIFVNEKSFIEADTLLLQLKTAE